MEIKEIKEYSLKVFNSVSGLLPQLSPGSSLLTEEDFRDIINQESVHFFVAEHKDKIVGMLTLAVYKIPTATRFWIEDVVVDEAERGKGFGNELIEFAIAFARDAGAKSIDLTSRPFRIAANHLYRKTGFKIRETNVYRYTLS